MTNNLVLYQLENCPYCQIVRKKLSQLNLPVQLVPVEAQGADRHSLFELSGQRSVPVLSDDENVVVGSDRILAHLDDAYGQPGNNPMPANDMGISTVASGSYEEVVDRTVEALKAQNFGVQAEIDIQATLKKKLDVDMPKQLILGACNPGIAHRLLEAEPEIGLLLPCNVTIREIGEDRFAVSAVHPVKLLAMIGREDLMPIAMEARDKLKAAIQTLDSE
jgi:uncharacterized protein (DUF302 family)/glutaredoxin